jgi:hypothetical protein
MVCVPLFYPGARTGLRAARRVLTGVVGTGLVLGIGAFAFWRAAKALRRLVKRRKRL